MVIQEIMLEENLGGGGGYGRGVFVEIGLEGLMLVGWKGREIG